MWRSRVLFGFALTLAVLVIVFYDDRAVGFTLLYAVLLLLLYAAASMVAARFCVRVMQSAEQQSVSKGEGAVIRLAIRNSGIFVYPNVAVRLSEPELLGYDGAKERISLWPRASIPWEVSVRFPYRGVYRAGVRALVLTDYLGLLCWEQPCRELPEYTVFPQNDEDFALSVRNEPQNAALQREYFQEDYSSVADVRKYAEADSLRRIHWKLSAKRGELISKTYESYEPNPVMLVLDTKALPLAGREKAAFEDRMVTYVASAVGYLMRAGLPGELVWGRGELLPVGRGDDMSRVFGVLAGIAFDRRESVLLSLRPQHPCNMALFLSDIDEAVHDAVVSLISFDHNVIVYYFAGESFVLTPGRESLLESLRAYGVGVNVVAA